MEQPSDSPIQTPGPGCETSATFAEVEALRQRLASLEAQVTARSQWRAVKLFRPGRARNITLLALGAVLAGVVIMYGQAAVQALFISVAGDVGIGVNPPTQKLDVAGTVRSRTGGFQFPDGSTQAKAAFNVPAGAVVAFNLPGCPDGWTEYAPAYGRFIRGIDKSNQSIDPQGRRDPGNMQQDAIPKITGTLTGVNGVPNQSWPGGFKPGTSGAFDVAYGYGAYNKYNGTDYSPPGGVGQVATFDSSRVLPNNTASEARPRNVALLYCQKN